MRTDHEKVMTFPLQRHVLRSAVLVIAGLVALADTVLAAPLLDQSHKIQQLNSATYVFGFTIAQTFTAGVAGQLSQVDLQLLTDLDNRREGLSVVNIFGTVAGVPDASQFLGSARFPGDDLLTFEDFLDGDLSQMPLTSLDVSSLGIMVSPGDVLAIELVYGRGFGALLWISSTFPEYEGGSSYTRVPPGDFSEFVSNQGPVRDDYGFQVWVERIPEPSSLVILLSACCFSIFGSRLTGGSTQSRSTDNS